MAGHRAKRPLKKKADKDEPELGKTRLLGPLLNEKFEKIAEYKRRKPRFLQKSLSTAEAASYLESGWTERKVGKTGDRIIVEKQKPHDEILEDRFWSILYQFGFDDLNAGRSFQIQVTSDGQPVRKQIDV